MISLRVNLTHRHHQRVSRVGPRWTFGCHIHGQRLDADEPETILGSQPAEKIGVPALIVVLFKPNLLPMTLVFPGNGDAFANRSIELFQKLLQVFFGTGF